MGSKAEERIRLKAEAALREVWPSARVIHELVLEQGGCRIDLAAVTPDRIIAVEVKSERDVLTRLKDQITAARAVADGVVVCLHEDHKAKARELVAWSADICTEDQVRPELLLGQRRVYETSCNAPARLAMLWAAELSVVAATGPRATRAYSIRKAADELTGAEVRRRVCAALRSRHFPRADPPIASDLFPNRVARQEAA